MYCGRRTQYLFRMRVCEGGRAAMWKSGSGSEKSGTAGVVEGLVRAFSPLGVEALERAGVVVPEAGLLGAGVV